MQGLWIALGQPELYQIRLIRHPPYRSDNKLESPKFKTERQCAVKQETLVNSVSVVNRIQAARSKNLCFIPRRGGDFALRLAVQKAMVFTESLSDVYRTTFRWQKAAWLTDHSDPYSEV
jgi:hypothetical protein